MKTCGIYEARLEVHELHRLASKIRQLSFVIIFYKNMSVGTRCFGCTWMLTWDNTNFTSNAHVKHTGYEGKALCNECGERVAKKLPLQQRDILEQKIPGSITKKENGKVWEVSGFVWIDGKKLALLYPNHPRITLLPGAYVTIY